MLSEDTHIRGLNRLTVVDVVHRGFSVISLFTKVGMK